MPQIYQLDRDLENKIINKILTRITLKSHIQVMKIQVNQEVEIFFIRP